MLQYIFKFLCILLTSYFACIFARVVYLNSHWMVMTRKWCQVHGTLSMVFFFLHYISMIQILWFWRMTHWQIPRFNDDIEWMTGKRPNLYWQVTWRVISPLMLLVVFLAYIVVQASTWPTYPAWNPGYVSSFDEVSLMSPGRKGMCQESVLNQ